jgi:hypothetical protein
LSVRVECLLYALSQTLESPYSLVADHVIYDSLRDAFQDRSGGPV